MDKQLLLSLFNRSLQSVRLGGLTGCVAHLQFRKNRSSNTIVHLIAVTLLLTCLPLLSTAQLVPLKTFQASLFAQTPEKKKEMEKAKTRKMDGKEYKDKSRIKVKDPALFAQSEENKIFSGPQPGEKLPSLMVTSFRGEIEGQTYDITTKSDGKPLVLFLQDSNGVGVKGLVNVSGLLLKIDALQKRHSKATGAETSNQGLQIGVVLLADNLETLPEWAHDMLKNEIPNEILTGLSPDGREGPGSYGLNRNVAQTVIVAKDGKVLHNFAFTQPMLYGDPHFLGAVAQAIEVDPATLEKWLNQTERYASEDLDEKTLAAKFTEIQKAIRAGKLSRAEAAEWLEKLGITWEEGEQLLRKAEGNTQMMRGERRRENRRRVEVKDPAGFSKAEETRLFSGPQPGEKLPPLMAKGINGAVKDKTYDVIAKADGQLLVLFLQDESGLGLRGLIGISRLLAQTAEQSKQKMHISAVFLGDTPDTLENQAGRLVTHIPNGVSLNISQDGREGPGSYGLNRNVAQTVIIAKDGKVLYNFAFAQPMLQPDPYVLGAVGEAIGIKPETLKSRLNRQQVEGARRMERSREQIRRGEDKED